MGEHRPVHEVGTGDLQGDAVRHLEIGMSPRLLHGADDVACGTLQLELRRDVGVEDDETAARQRYLEEGTPLRPSGNVDIRAAFWRP